MTQFESISILLTVFSLTLQGIKVVQPLLRDVMVNEVSDPIKWKCTMMKKHTKLQHQEVAQQANSIDATSFGDCVRRQREQRGWSLPQLVQEMDTYSPEKIGPNTLTIRRWENGACLPSKRNLALLCLVFKMSKEDLGITKELYDSLRN